jgi:hypothetical protein
MGFLPAIKAFVAATLGGLGHKQIQRVTNLIVNY